MYLHHTSPALVDLGHNLSLDNYSVIHLGVGAGQIQTAP